MALAAAGALAGCFTPTARVPASQAVLEARAHGNVTAAEACPQTPLAQVSPVMVGFSFDAANPADVPAGLEAATPWILCHPATPILVRPQADGRGSPADQDTLARQRAQAVRTYLVARGVAPARIALLPRTAPETAAGAQLLIRAEGRRW